MFCYINFNGVLALNIIIIFNGIYNFTMKYTLAIAAILGFSAIEETNAITVFTTRGEVAYVQETDSSDDDENTDVQLNGGDSEEEDHSNEYFLPGQHEMLGGGGYERVTPARFANDADDIFMRSMIEQYALEQKNKDGTPSGKFWIDEAGARAAAREVLETNCRVAGGARDSWLNTYFGRAWAHFDVNRSGKVEVIKMPQFMRFLCSDQQMYLW
jgi:hypothetical protein